MALDRFNENMDIIAGLGDDPKRDDGLSTPQFKSVFDKAGLLIQKFLNEKLIPQVENFLDEGTVLGKITEALSRKLDKTGGTMEGSINMNGQTLKGLNAPTTYDAAAHKGYVDAAKNDANKHAEELVKTAAPYNYADNSDFTQWVAQPGLCKSHAGSVAIYAGDRWILDSGTLTGDAREDGNGYTNIRLNGTIRQIVANAPDVGTVAIEMVSGTADISYANGVITISSNSGVIKNVRLFKGSVPADTRPVYQPKGYGAELAECMRYFYKTVIRRAALNVWNLVDSCFYYPIPMRLSNLTVALIEPNTGWIGHASMWYDGTQYDNVEVSVVETSNTFARINSKNGQFNAGADIAINVEVSADL